ncbi:hypothetical protein [uncultured Rikenella sp.]|uniref:hypothetical protein n=1 Tax=uncultured Rikenella sp. TaxID=368003 RepID=UPI00272B66EB|nr:hypothetical protein [uncultured Rikenella sp.]
MTLFSSHPAPGYRDAGIDGRLGELMGVGSLGYSWSSTIDGSLGSLNLNFHVTWLSSNHASYRGYGFQLRCLSE